MSSTHAILMPPVANKFQMANWLFLHPQLDFKHHQKNRAVVIAVRKVVFEVIL